MKNYVLKLSLYFLATFMYGLSNGQTNPTPHDLSLSNYTFTGFASGATTAYPTSMQGWSFSSEPNTSTVVSPNADRFLVESTSPIGTGSIRNEVGNGISLLNSGTNHIGAIVVSANALNRTNLTVTWTAEQLNSGGSGATDRINGLRLQYRIGTSGNFTEVLSSSYLTTNTTSQNPAQTFTNIALPPAANNEAEVQIRWIYYISSGSANARDRIRLDDITISSSPLAALCTAPTTQASAISFSNISDVSMDINWTNGNGDGRVIIMNTTNSFTAPVDGTNPTANTAYSGSGEQLVYNGTGGGPVNITGLTPNTTYWFRVYEFCNPNRVYQTATSTDNPNSETTLSCLATTHYFRSISTGNWNALSTWESSTDEVTWVTPACVPDFNANTIRIRNGHTVTINTALDVDQIIIENGGVLRKENGGVMTLRDGAGDDIAIENGGILEYAGANIPSYQNADVRIRVQSGGRIRVTNNVSGISNNLGGNGSSNRIIYEHQSIFEWNNATVIASSNQIYFPDVDAVTIPTFLLSSNTGNVGANAPNNLTFNGVFEANGNITFTSDGEKYFRNGILGTGNISQTSTTGRFYITGGTAYLGGTGVINLDFERINVNPGVNLILTSNKTINTTNANPSLGQLRMTDGSTIDMGPYELSGTANVRFNTDVVIRTAHPNGLDGAFTGLAASDFVTPFNQTFDFYGVGSQFSGFVSPGACANLIVGAGTWLQVVENLDVSNTITMNAGSVIIVAAGETLRLTNPSVGALVGGNLVGATNYIHGRLQRATTTGNTYQFPLGFPPYSAQGFTITVTGSGEILGNMESNTSAPLLDYVYCDLETPTIPGQQIGQGLPVQDGILDQMFLDLQSPAQWEITNPGVASLHTTLFFLPTE